jgi:hypothetical protein
MSTSNTKPQKIGLILLGLALFCSAQSDQSQYQDNSNGYQDPTQLDYSSQNQPDYSLASMPQVMALPPIPGSLPGSYSGKGSGRMSGQRGGSRGGSSGGSRGGSRGGS